MSENEYLLIYPWSMSATGQWSIDTGLHKLRDCTANELADLLWEHGIFVQQTAVAEIVAHGNPRKAAEFLRALVSKHPDLTDKIRSQYRILEREFFDLPLSNLPGSPKEYPPTAKIQYIQ